MTRISSEVFFVCNEIWDKNNFVECSFLRNFFYIGEESAIYQLLAYYTDKDIICQFAALSGCLPYLTKMDIGFSRVFLNR